MYRTNFVLDKIKKRQHEDLEKPSTWLVN